MKDLIESSTHVLLGEETSELNEFSIAGFADAAKTVLAARKVILQFEKDMKAAEGKAKKMEKELEGSSDAEKSKAVENLFKPIIDKLMKSDLDSDLKQSIVDAFLKGMKKRS